MMLRTRYALPELKPHDLYTIAARIEAAITDAMNLDRIKLAALDQPRG
jgi:hypothetical protein